MSSEDVGGGHAGRGKARSPPVGETPLSGVTRPPGMSRGRVVNSHATPP